MLDEARSDFITASQAHLVMAGFKSELEGKKAVEPDSAEYPHLELWINKYKRKPLVGELKSEGLLVKGSDIKEAWDFIKSQEKVFSDGMYTAALNIAMKNFINERDESFTSGPMDRGNIQEGEAISELSKYLNIDFSNTGDNQSFLSEGCLGVTPDGIQYDGFSIKSCAEVKNPLDTTHMRYLATLRTQEDMLKECREYYWQAQTGLAVTGAEVYHWASYHNGFKEEYGLVYVPVYRNEDHIEILKDRAQRVIDRVPGIVEDVKSIIGDSILAA